ncbi:MAG: extracellular solute-binding protein [Rhodobacter sp.]|nr:extracellular solute-binding protein [Rhodobacter sp.]
MKNLTRAITLTASILSTTSLHAGEVVVYAAHGDDVTGAILDAFRARHTDIDVTLVVGKTGDMFQRIKAEAGNPAADMMWGGSIQSYEVFADLFAPFENENEASMAFVDPDHKWQAFTVFAQPLMVNTDLVDEANYPSTVAEVLDRKWDDLGGVVLADPNDSGTGHTIVSGLAGGMGWDFTTELIKRVRPTPGSDPMFTAVRDGEAALGWVNEDLGAKWEAEGLPVKMIYPTDGLTVQVDAYGLVAGGPNPEDARKLMAFIGSTEGQILAVEVVKRRSPRSNVPPPGELPALASLPLFPEVEPRSVIKAKFTDIRSQ